MRTPKVVVLYKKDSNDEKDRAKEIVKIFTTAGQMMSKHIDVEMSSDLRDFRDFQFKKEELPVVIVNNQIVFTKHVPPLEFIKQIIATPQEQQNFF